MYDIRILNAAVLDGTGAVARPGEVAVKDGRIAAVGGRVGEAVAELDAGGCIVCPGFIDLHNHARPGAVMNFLQQGVTTIVTGNCGFGVGDVAEVERECRERPCGPNLAVLVGHNSVRQRAMGRADRPPTASELDGMKQDVARGMEAGAVGFSSGLAYVPGVYARTEEVIALARAAADFGGYYTSHIRNERNRLLESLNEALEIGRASGLPTHVSHLKVTGAAHWGGGAKAVALLDEARRAGMDATADQYPYTASCARIQLICPTRLIEGDAAVIRGRLNDPAQRRRAVEELTERLATDYRGELWRVVVASCAADPALPGKTLEDVCRMKGRGTGNADGAETVLDLLALAPDDRSLMCVYHNMSEDDVRAIMRWPHGSVASDGWAVALGEGMPHPRLYGAFPRVLARYCREQGVLSLETAIRKMTSLPAARLALSDRGTLREGAWADLVVFDRNAVADRATFDAPHRYPEGIAYVIVNGRLILDHGRQVGEFAGKFLRRAAAPSAH